MGVLRRFWRVRPVRWTRRLARVLAVVVGVLLLAQVAVLPGLVRRSALATLAEAGLPGASLEVRNVSLWGADLANVSLDEEGRVTVGALAVRYGLSSLSRARVRLIEVTGAEVQIRLRDGELDLGPLADIQSEGGDGGGDLPFDRVEVRASSILLDVDGQRVRIPFHGSLADLGAGRIELDLAAAFERVDLRLAGTVDTNTYDADIELAGTVHNLGGPSAAAPPAVERLLQYATGPLTFKVHVVSKDGETTVAFESAGKGLAASGSYDGAKVLAEGVSFRVAASGRLAEAPHIEALTASFGAERASVGGEEARSLVLKAKRQGDVLRIEGSAAGPYWKLTRLTAQVAGLFAPPAESADATRDLSGKLSWQAEGRLPAWLIGLLRRIGVETEGFGKASVEGRAAARLVYPARGGPADGQLTATLDDVQVALTPGRVAYWPEGLDAHGLAAQARLTGTVTARLSGEGGSPEADVELSLAPGSAARLAGARAIQAGLRAVLLRDDAPSAVARVGEAGGKLAASLRSGRWTWSARVADLRLEAAQGTAALPSLGLEARRLAATARATLLAEGAWQDKGEDGQEVTASLGLAFRPGSSLAVAEVAVDQDGLDAGLRAGEAPCISARIEKEDAELSATWDGEELSWRASVPFLRVEATGGYAEARGAGVEVRGVAASVLASLAAGSALREPELLRVELRPDSLVTVSQARVDLPEIRASCSAAGEPSVVARLVESAVFTVSQRDDELTWRAQAPRLRLRAIGLGASSASAGIGAAKGAVDVHLSASAKPGRLSGKLLAGATVTVGSLTTGDGLALKLTPAHPDTPAVALTVGKKGGEWRLSPAEEDDAGQLRYRLDLPEVRIVLAETDISVPGAKASVEKLSASLSLGARFKTSGMTLRASGPCSVGFAAASAAAGGETLCLGPARLLIEARGDDPLVDLVYDGWTRRWAVGLKARAAEPVRAALGTDGKATLATLSAEAAAIHDASGMRLSGALDLVASAIGLKRPGNGTTLTLSVPRAALRAQLSGEFVGMTDTVALADLPLTLKTSVAAEHIVLATTDHRPDGAPGAASRLTLTGAGVDVEGTVAFDRGGLAWDGKVGVRLASVAHKPSGLRACGIFAEVPVWLSREPGEAGKFAVGSIEYGKDKLPALSGAARVVGTRADFRLAWPLLDGPDPFEPDKGGATLAVDGWLDVRGGVPRGEVKLAVPRFELGDGNQPKDLWEIVKGFEVTGAFALDGHVKLVGDRVAPLITVKAENARVASDEWSAAIEGINATIRLDSVAPLSTPGGQRIRIGKANLGKLEVTNGVVDFRLESPESIFLERAEFGWAGGRLYTYALRVNPSAPTIDLVVYADGLDLGQLLRLIPNERFDGKGTLYGRLPVSIGRWPDIRFQPGFLYATPGEKGWVKFKDAPFVGETLESRYRTFRTDPIQRQLKEQIVQALSELEYTVFRTDFVRTEDFPGQVRLKATVLVVGKGRRGERLEFGGLRVNVPGFDEVIRDALLQQRDLESLFQRPASGKGDDK